MTLEQIATTSRVMARFIAKIELGPNDCWNWRASKTERGYGRFYKVQAHRFCYFACNPEPIKGKHIHHTCNNTSCVNPAHLVSVSAAEHWAMTPRHKGYLTLRYGVCKRGHAM